MLIHRLDQAQLMSWANGAGRTREVLRSPETGADYYDWRISVADVEHAGSFSSLAGIDRTIVLCEGGRMVLCVDGQSVELDEGQPFSFSGDAHTYCQVPEGTTRALNVMSRRRTTTATTELLRVNGRRALDADQADLVLVSLTPGVSVGGYARELGLFDSVHAQGEDRLAVDGTGVVLAARFRGAAATSGTASRGSDTAGV